MVDEHTSRDRLLGALVAYCDRVLALPVDASRRAAVNELGRWLAARRTAAEPAQVIVICTGNSRRSVFGSVLGNLGAAYAGASHVRFYSGGTEPSAVNPRALQALAEIGVEIEPAGELASPGPAGAPNPIYRLRWGQSVAGSAMEMAEFSKHFADAANPHSGFAAVMVCDQANEACPVVSGASVRIALPFADPKDHDGTERENAEYARRRDEIARALLACLLPD